MLVPPWAALFGIVSGTLGGSLAGMILGDIAIPVGVMLAMVLVAGGGVLVGAGAGALVAHLFAMLLASD